MSAHPIATRPPASARPKKPRSTGRATSLKAVTTATDIPLSPLVSPADLVGGPELDTTPAPVISSRRSHPGRLRIALLATGLPVLTAGTAALVAVALSRA